ncbi:hypothetical protein SAZ_00575 [Streptomyces noursei ZPM]|uniref:Uncharacterized protein n=1 Tax=Streptomyces noursei TaxID=1971 RepID=A0A401QRX2_STRNR|nr:hypothetical protein [Streptomyces noursei]AKA08309.1 hypothetical protein SAZ_00575 [Streptomyces noursei ZPM]EOT05224.1 hypothetical protein K530_04605 [Streptomyces noursei CCRC 11814]EXU92479.1 hypothetical protein P354_21630 [Streptomyces noursei PD-1]GCB88156.1 hypothetical protein SALB_00825 [Streptomyces noursei]
MGPGLRLDGPPAAERLVLLQRSVALEEGPLELAAAGPTAAAAALAAANGAADGYTIVLHRLVQSRLGRLADVPAVLAARRRRPRGPCPRPTAASARCGGWRPSRRRAGGSSLFGAI